MLSDLHHRLRALFRRDAMERELEDELRFHLQHDAAGRPRSRDFAELEQVKEACRDARGISAIDHLRQDLRYALRMLGRHPAFSLTVIATLGIGIGAATTMFGVVDGVLLKPLPYPDADRIVRIGRTFGGVRVSSTSAPDYESLSSGARAFSRIAVGRTQDMDVSAGPPPERLKAAFVSASYFDVFGVRPAMGQALSPQNDRQGTAQVAVISDSFWRRALGAGKDVVGRSIVVDGAPHTIVGVLPTGFRGPEALDHDRIDLWLPLGRVKLSVDPDDASLTTVAAMAPGVDQAAALRELDRVGGAGHFWMAALQDETIGAAAGNLWLLFTAVALLLVLACANVANLFVVRAADRAREIAVRTALGAGAARIARQLITETLTFGIAGGLVGAVVAYSGIALVRLWAPPGLPRIADLHVDARVLLFAFLIATLAGLVFGALPALDARRSNPGSVLRGSSSFATLLGGRIRHRAVLVVLQTAIATILAVSALLLANSAFRLSRVNPGFDPSNVVWLDVNLPERAYPGAAPKAQFFDELLVRARAIADVRAVSVIQGRPLGGGNSISTVAPEGHLPAEGEGAARVPFHVVAPGYFSALRIAQIDGRDFGAGDRAGAPRVAIVSRAFAERFWKGQRAIGKRFWMGRVAADAPLTEVVGIVEDVRQYGLDQAPMPIVYRALSQVPRGAATLVARLSDDAPAGAIDRLRSALWTMDSTLALDRAGTMDSEVTRSIREPRFRATALSAFGIIAIAIACLGLYGTLTWTVRARRREIGIRIALGADVGALGIAVIGRGLRLAAYGIALGLGAAVVITQLVASMLYGVSALDPATFAATAATMLVAALLASWLPARSAARADPVSILRDA